MMKKSKYIEHGSTQYFLILDPELLLDTKFPDPTTKLLLPEIPLELPAAMFELPTMPFLMPKTWLEVPAIPFMLPITVFWLPLMEF